MDEADSRPLNVTIDRLPAWSKDKIIGEEGDSSHEDPTLRSKASYDTRRQGQLTYSTEVSQQLEDLPLLPNQRGPFDGGGGV